MGFTDVPDKSSGDVFLEAMWDTYIKDNFNSGVLRKLADTTLAADAANIDLTAIPATFAHLLLLADIRTADTGIGSELLRVRLNNDSGANYDYLSALADSASAAPTKSQGFAQTSILLGYMPNADAPASTFGGLRLELVDYANATRHKAGTFQSVARYDAAGGSAFAGGLNYRSAAAISRITIFSDSGANLVTGSRVTLLGVPA